MKRYFIAAVVSWLAVMIILGILGEPSWAVASRGWFGSAQYHGWIHLFGLTSGPAVWFLYQFQKKKSEEEAWLRHQAAALAANASTPDERRYYGYIIQSMDGSLVPDDPNDVAALRESLKKASFMRDFEEQNPQVGFSVGRNVLPTLQKYVDRAETPHRAVEAARAEEQQRSFEASAVKADLEECITNVTQIFRALTKDNPGMAGALNDIEKNLQRLEAMVDDGKVERSEISDVIDFCFKRVSDLDIDDPLIRRRLSRLKRNS